MGHATLSSIMETHIPEAQTTCLLQLCNITGKILNRSMETAWKLITVRIGTRDYDLVSCNLASHFLLMEGRDIVDASLMSIQMLGIEAGAVLSRPASFWENPLAPKTEGH